MSVKYKCNDLIILRRVYFHQKIKLSLTKHIINFKKKTYLLIFINRNTYTKYIF